MDYAQIKSTMLFEIKEKPWMDTLSIKHNTIAQSCLLKNS